MKEKIASFLFTLAIIAWQVIEMIQGRATTFTWIVLGFFSLVGIFELNAIFSARKKSAVLPENVISIDGKKDQEHSDRAA